MPPPIILVFLLFPVLFLVIWCLVCKIISNFGWKDLAKKYTAFSQPEGTCLRGESMALSLFGNYKGCVTFQIGKTGLGISVMRIFGIGHPRLFFPWSAVRFLKERDSMLGKRYLYDLGTPRIRRIALSSEVHRAIQQQQAGAGS